MKLPQGPFAEFALLLLGSVTKSVLSEGSSDILVSMARKA